jgi:transposase
MGMAQLVVAAVLLEGRSKAEVARSYGVSRRWVITLGQRYLAEGDAGLLPRSRGPRTSPRRTGQAVEDEIIAIRKELDRHGHEAGAATIAFHLAQRHGRSPAVSTIWRILSQRGFITPQPHKRPKSSYLRFAAEQPNERWQADITHWQLADGTGVEIFNIIDDHSRLCLDTHASRVFIGSHVEDRFCKPPPPMATRPACSPTTLRYSPDAPAATAESPWRSPCTPAASASDTAGPTTRRPAARWSASTKHSRNGSPANPPPPPCASYKPSSTTSPATTTPCDRTEHSPAEPRHRPTPPDQSGPHRRPTPRRPLAHPPRPHRPHRRIHPATQHPPTPHRHRPTPRRHRHPRPDPRPRHPRAHHRRRTHPRTRPQPQPGLPTPAQTVNDVPRHL